jgi:hypothetical protein
MSDVCPVMDVFEKSDWKREGWERLRFGSYWLVLD